MELPEYLQENSINNNKERQSGNINPDKKLLKENQNTQAKATNKVKNSKQINNIQLSDFIQETRNINQNNQNNKFEILQTGQKDLRKQIIDNNNYYNPIDNSGNINNEIICPDDELEQKDYKSFENKNLNMNQKEQSISINDNIKQNNFNKETKNIFGNQLNNIIKSEEIKNDIFINIIYLVDLTLSMKKHRKILNNIEKINISLKERYPNMIFGYVFYRDFIYSKSNTLQLNLPHIKIFKSSPLNYQIPNDFNFVRNYTSALKFEGGGDYAEDWANAYFEISQFNIDINYENIVIHFCDSGAHGHKFSDYDDNNEQEKLLVEALKKCSLKKIKIIGLIFNEFNRKSFLLCQKIYNKKYEGYYNLVDLTYFDLDFIDWVFVIKENIEKALKNIINENFDDYTRIRGFEKGFDFDDEKDIQMLKLEYIKQKYFDNKIIKFLPDFGNENIQQILNKYGKFKEDYPRKKTEKEIINNSKFEML